MHFDSLKVLSVYTPPVIILCQSHLLKVNVKSLAFRGLKDPVTRQIVAVVARETRGDNATVGGVFYHPSTGCCGGKRCRKKKEGEGLKGRILQNSATLNFSRRVWRKVQAFAKIASLATGPKLDHISSPGHVCESGAVWWIFVKNRKTLSVQSSCRKMYDRMSLQYQDKASHVVQF